MNLDTYTFKNISKLLVPFTSTSYNYRNQEYFICSLQTQNFERMVPDSASTATALMTGHKVRHQRNKTASFQNEAMRTQVALYFFHEVKFV